MFDELGSRDLPDAMQWLMAGCGLACTIAVYFGLPETAHSKLIDVKKDEIETQTGHRPKFLWVWGNPFTALSLLRRPNVFIMVSCDWCSNAGN